jgi:hypothetical protein
MSNGRMTGKNKGVAASLKVLSKNLLGGTEENIKYLSG